MQRAVTGLIGAFGVVLVIFQGSENFFLGIVTASIVIASYEFHKITGEGRISFSGFVALLLSPAVPAFFYFYPYNPLIAVVSFSVVVTMSAKIVFGPGERPPRDRYETSLFGLIYVAPLLSHFLLLRSLENGSGAVFFVLMTVWMSDSVAYYTGKNFGTRRLAPTVSPGKTMEGAAGGLVGGVTGAVLASLICFPELTPLKAALAGGVVGATGQVGDLAESLIKREWGVKDSGTIIPGHGGLLDRLDSLFFAGPVFCLFLLVNGLLSF
ncbi:MAG: phosphatidate cytidylyltransferase [Nitrospinota bacterium]